MVSSDSGRGLTGIPVTQSALSSVLWPLGDSTPYTLYSHWATHMRARTHTFLKVISKAGSLFIAQRDDITHHTRLTEKLETIIDQLAVINCRRVITQRDFRLLILLLSYCSCCQKHTSSNQSKLVFLISDLLLINISSREEKSHHSFEELVHQLDGERHHIDLRMETVTVLSEPYSTQELKWLHVIFLTSKCSFTEIPPTGGRTLLKIRKANCRPDWQLLWGRSTTYKRYIYIYIGFIFIIHGQCYWWCVTHAYMSVHATQSMKLWRAVGWTHLHKQDGVNTDITVLSLYQQSTYPHTLHRGNQA